MKSRETCGDPYDPPYSLDPMGERWQRFAAEVGRFLAVGLLATIVALILFNLLVHGFNTGELRPAQRQAGAGLRASPTPSAC